MLNCNEVKYLLEWGSLVVQHLDEALFTGSEAVIVLVHISSEWIGFSLRL